ncbi:MULTISPECIES: PIG-L deacetylase family protein [unclassified Meiothermus]|uniref:PIG-L deacetylase family protein n=1 Tax=unclassified Meiothermus TaxID=370471 RepID=UPI000D7CAB85|nr:MULTISPECIES: PIG-L family deacetylase [unclassified Meiothermus]PZA07941.1 PIG-L family deacetylase [Meiothermus sp. Pnk-1]RYM36714.1 PIG-L family deacetylase [Meiothermus sp. PNK-Is4]
MRLSVAPRRFKKRYLALAAVAVLFLAINAPGLVAVGYRLWYMPQVARLPTLSFGQERLLVLSPHPDDETLCCAGAIQQVLRAGGQVYVVWFTSGDGFEWAATLTERTLRPRGRASLELGNRRILEARKAAGILGIPEANLYFLGYPDRGLGQMVAHPSRRYRSRLTGVDAVPYAQALSPGAAYTGQNLEYDFEQVLNAVRPTLVLAPSPKDAHPDHRAVGEVAIRVLGRRGELERLRYWIVHGGLEWPLPKGLHPALPLEPPPRGRGLPWERLDLDSEEEQTKLEATRAHGSQMELLSRFMLAFVRKNELYSPTPLP